MLVFLFYSILLFSQVKCINYSSIFSFQSFSLHILPSKVPISQQGFKTRCSQRGDNMGCTQRKTIVYSSSFLSWVRRKANRGGSPLQYYLRAQTVDLERQPDHCVYQLWSLFCYFVWREQGRIVCAVVVIIVHFPSTGLMYSKLWASNWEKKTGEVICNQLYAPCNACGSFKRPSKIWSAAWSGGTLWNSVNNSLRIKFKLCMCSSVQSSVNSYALNGLDDWQHPFLCGKCFFFLGWEKVQANIISVFSL